MIARNAYQRLVWCLYVLLMLGTSAYGSGAEYELDGEIMQTSFKPDGGVQKLTKSKFTVFVKDCSWLIQTTDQDEAGKPMIARETGCINGTEVYEVQGPPKANSAGARTLHNNVATIVSNIVPVGQMDDYLVCHLWEMFASGCYFDKLCTNWITPVYDLNASAAVDPDLKREAKWELINGQGSLPSNVVYLESVRLRNSPVHTNATYVATGVTNAGEIRIPSGFVFEERIGSRFAPGPVLPGSTNAAYRIRKQAVATVTAVREGCSRSDLSPEASGMTMVIDQRVPPTVVPTGTTTFSQGEVQSLSGFALKLKRHSDKVSAFLWQTLSNETQVSLTNTPTSAKEAFQVRDVVLEVLNKAVRGSCIYETNRFKGISLRSETINLLSQSPTGDKLVHLNRLLLQDAYPVELAPATHLSAYVVQDGVEWLPVEKAKQVYMKPPGPPQKPSHRVAVVFYISMLSVSAVFFFFMIRLKLKDNIS